MLVTAEDIVLSGSIESIVTDCLVEKRLNEQLKRSVDGRYRFKIPVDRHIESSTDLPGTLRYLAAFEKHRRYIIDNITDVFNPLEVSTLMTAGLRTVGVLHAGIQSHWSLYEISSMMGVKRDSIPKLSNNLLSEVVGSSHWAVSIKSKPGDTLLSQSYALARTNALASAVGITTSASRDHAGKHLLYLDTNYIRTPDGARHEVVSLSALGKVKQLVDLTDTPRLISANQVWSARAEILERTAAANNTVKNVLRQVNQKGFTDYWRSLKSDIVASVSHTEAYESWQSIPLLPTGTATSRTWGIEIETVQAQLVPRRPAGWDRKGDGSLEPLDDSCSCSCDYCYEGEHYECGDSDCQSDSCAEFVSPILNHFNSDGLRVITSGLDGSEVNTTPGIHVHVGAGDLSVADVARLVRSYSAVAPYVLAIAEREVTNYCKETSTENIQFWLSQARDHVRNGLGTQAVDVCYSQPDDRYHDLNLQALRNHGTVEFRVMGPKYSYDHLVRWAWFCREMVNISKLDLPQRVWTSVRSMSDVLAILFQYGSERSPEAWVAANKAEPMALELTSESRY